MLDLRSLVLNPSESLSEKLSNRSKGLNMIAKDLEHGQHWNGQQCAWDAHSHPQKLSPKKMRTLV